MALGRRLVCAFVLAAGPACGANVVFVEEDGEGGGGAATTPSTSGPTTGTASTGAGAGTQQGLTEEILGENVPAGTFQAAATAGTLGLTLFARAEDPFQDLEIQRLRAPSQALVYDDILPQNGWEWLWYGAMSQATPQISHAETFPLAQGTWSWDVASPGPVSVSAWRRSTVDGAFHGGVLDVNVFIADGYASEDDALDALTSAFDGWAGIDLGDVRFFAIGAEYLAVDDQNLFDLLGETAAASSRPSLNLMLVAAIEGSFEGAAGFSVGVPGTGLYHGSNLSMVVWMYLADPFFDPIILAHEAGHFAGLFHTSELEAGLGDPIDDTPLCPDVFSLGEACPDYDLIMFPTGGSGSALFSESQRAVVQASTLYRGVFAPGEPPSQPIDTRQDSGAAASAADKAAARARVGALRAAPVPAAAHDGYLRGVGCPHTASGPADYYAALEGLARRGMVPADAGSWLTLALDPREPSLVRRRALGMAARLEPGSSSVRDVVAALAQAPGETSVVRSGALRTLARIAPQAARDVARPLAAEGDPLLAGAARRALGR